MLPFLKPKAQTGVIIKERAPDAQDEHNDSDGDYSLEDCAKDLLHAVESKDIKRIAEEIRNIYLFLHNEIDKPEDEDHIEPHSYDASKED
jgi:hypothetical protein